MTNEQYSNPLVARYASSEMSWIFSDKNKFLTWRKCWIALATAQKELGLPITDAQIGEMRQNINKLDLEKAFKFIQEVRSIVKYHSVNEFNQRINDIYKKIKS